MRILFYVNDEKEHRTVWESVDSATVTALLSCDVVSIAEIEPDPRIQLKVVSSMTSLNQFGQNSMSVKLKTVRSTQSDYTIF